MASKTPKTKKAAAKKTAVVKKKTASANKWKTTKKQANEGFNSILPGPEYVRREGSKLLVPTGTDAVVPVQKISKGITKAKAEIQLLVDSLADLTDGYEVEAINLSVSFNAKGEFLGIGVGGATTISIRFKPTAVTV